VFVNLHPDRSWTPINNTYGVIRLLTNRNRLNPRPLFIADSFIESIEDLRRKSERKEGLPPNTIVRIRQRDHPFYDYTGTVIGMDLSSRVRVLMSLFSRELMVTLQVTDVEILSE
jgi:transcription antitermination factor NusG